MIFMPYSVYRVVSGSETGRQWSPVRRTSGSLLQRHVGNSVWWLVRQRRRYSCLQESWLRVSSLAIYLPVCLSVDLSTYTHTHTHTMDCTVARSTDCLLSMGPLMDIIIAQFWRYTDPRAVVTRPDSDMTAGSQSQFFASNEGGTDTV